MTGTFAFIQARMSSSRFPGKVLEPICGLPMIIFMARRVARSKLLDGVAILTSDDRSDDALANVAESASIAVFRGALHDVLGRYAAAAKAFDAQEIVRLTGDCPLMDPQVVDDVISTRRAYDADYGSNVEPPTYPDGLDVECFTRDALDRASLNARLLSEREHVTPWLRDPVSGTTRVNCRALVDLSTLRLTVDYPDDLQAVGRVVSALADPGSADLFEILRVLSEQRDILQVNRHPRNEGLARSVANDKTGGE